MKNCTLFVKVAGFGPQLPARWLPVKAVACWLETEEGLKVTLKGSAFVPERVLDVADEPPGLSAYR